MTFSNHVYHFAALHGMPAWTSDEKSVHPSVCQTNGL